MPRNFILSAAAAGVLERINQARGDYLRNTGHDLLWVDIGRHMGWGQPTASAVKNGKRGVTLEEIPQLAALLRAPLDWLAFGDMLPDTLCPYCHMATKPSPRRGHPFAFQSPEHLDPEWGQRLRQWREEVLQVTQQQLLELLQQHADYPLLSDTVISRLENAQAWPSLALAHALAQVDQKATKGQGAGLLWWGWGYDNDPTINTRRMPAPPPAKRYSVPVASPDAARPQARPRKR